MQLLVFFVILSVLVIVHELGHFFAAKFFKMRVEEFGFGLPPRAKKLFTKGGTLFSLNWLPIGGFVKLYGEDMEDEDQVKSSEAFFNKPAWQRAVVLTAGVTMNFILGIFLFATVYSFLGIPTKTDRVSIVEITKDSPAEKAGIEVDSIVKGFKTTEEFVSMVNENKGKEVTLNLIKNGQEKKVVVIPREKPPVGEGALGVSLSNIEMIHFPWWQMPFRGAVTGLQEAWAWGKEIVNNLGQLVYRVATGKGLPSDIAGPVGIYQVSKSVYKMGSLAVLQFAGVLSINLGVLNIMPFPALDGGRLIFIGVERIIGKKRKNKIEGYVHTAGMIFLLGLMALITIKDVIKLFHK